MNSRNALKSSGNVYGFMYAFLIQTLEQWTPLCDDLPTNQCPEWGSNPHWEDIESSSWDPAIPELI